MKSRYTVPLVLVAVAISSTAMAGDDCNTAMAQWQTRDQVSAHIEQFGISVQRLRIDDGCYKVRGQDEDGNRVELQLDPGTLAIMELEIRFRSGADTTRYLPPSVSRAPSGNR